MIVLDTHVWIWWLTAPSKLSRKARAAIASSDMVGVSAMSALELATLVRKGRLTLDRPVVEWVRAAFAEPRALELPMTAEIAALAGGFGEDFHGDPGDRVIAATCLAHAAPLVTKDDALRAMPMLQAVW